jgi:hypothetical protein
VSTPYEFGPPACSEYNWPNVQKILNHRGVLWAEGLIG